MLKISFVIEIPICYPGQIIFDRPMINYDDKGYYITGYPTVCYDGALAPICNTTDLGALDISTICVYSAGLVGTFYNAQASVIISVFRRCNRCTI